jgi:hypothetical protein
MVKKIIIIISFCLFFINSVVFCDDIIIYEAFNSLNNINKIEYMGADRFGSGTFYKIDIQKNNEILTTALGSIGPRVNWYGDYIAEIFIYYGPGTNSSYFYLFNYEFLTKKIDSVLYILPNMLLILNSDDMVNINIRSLVTNNILQTVKIEGIDGSSLSNKNLFDTVIITDNEIILSTDYEPNTGNALKEPRIYRFKKLFNKNI